MLTWFLFYQSQVTDPSHVRRVKALQHFAFCPVTSAAFVPTAAVEEALQKSCGKLQERLTQKIICSLSPHMTPTGKVVRGFTLLRRIEWTLRWRAQEGGKEWSGWQKLKDLKADLPQRSQPLYFGVIITHCGQVTMLLVHMIDSRISNPSACQPGSLAGALRTTGRPRSLWDPRTHTHTSRDTHADISYKIMDAHTPK